MLNFSFSLVHSFIRSLKMNPGAELFFLNDYFVLNIWNIFITLLVISPIPTWRQYINLRLRLIIYPNSKINFWKLEKFAEMLEHFQTFIRNKGNVFEQNSCNIWREGVVRLNWRQGHILNDFLHADIAQQYATFNKCLFVILFFR